MYTVQYSTLYIQYCNTLTVTYVCAYSGSPLSNANLLLAWAPLEASSPLRKADFGRSRSIGPVNPESIIRSAGVGTGAWLSSTYWFLNQLNARTVSKHTLLFYSLIGCCLYGGMRCFRVSKTRQLFLRDGSIFERYVSLELIGHIRVHLIKTAFFPGMPRLKEEEQKKKCNFESQKQYRICLLAIISRELLAA